MFREVTVLRNKVVVWDDLLSYLSIGTVNRLKIGAGISQWYSVGLRAG